MKRQGRNMISSKRGQTVLDMIFVLIVLFLLGLASVFGFMIFSQVNDEIQADNDMSPEAKGAANTVNVGYTSWFDKAFLLVFALLWIMLLVTSFLIDAHPVFFIVTVVLLLFTFVAGMIISNTYQDIMADGDLSLYAAQFPTINFVFGNFLLVLIVMGLTAGLALYAKNKF